MSGAINEIRYGTLDGVGYHIGVAEHGQIFYSTDGARTWTCFTIGGDTFTDIEYGNNQFIAVGFGGVLATIRPSGVSAMAAPGITWQTVSHGPGGEWIALGLEVTGGGFSFIEWVAKTTNDGNSWSLFAPPPEMGHPAGTTSQWLGSTFANGWYVAVRWDGRIQRGIDGLNWETVADATNTLYDVAYGNGAWIAVGDNGQIGRSTSPQALTWSLFGSGAPNLYGVGFGGGYFVAAGLGGQIRSSTDGLAWTLQTSPVPPADELYASGYGANEWFVGGHGSRIAQTQPLANLVPYQAPGLSSPLVLASAPTATVDDWLWTMGADSMWVRFTPANFGAGDTPPFTATLRTNGNIVATIAYPSLQALSYFLPISLKIAVPQPYPYSFQVDVDAAAAVNETSETDNAYVKTAATADVSSGRDPHAMALSVRVAGKGRVLIEYSPPGPGPTVLRISDVQGRLVRELRLDTEQAGAQLVEWAGDDQAGRRVTPGVYFVNLSTVSARASRKFVYAP